tara:strand:+ start:293 stop:511 length:219 start_codon:yes stop_codon:yes gene_type:complete
MMAVSTYNHKTGTTTMKTYVIMYHSGKVEVITNENPQAALDYIADNHEYIEVIYQGELVDFPKAKEENQNAQ